MSDCNARRAGVAVMEFQGLPFSSVRASFTGTGTASFDASRFIALQTGARIADELPITWLHSKFVGEHWLLGRFKIELDPSRVSTGVVRRIGSIETSLQNVNYFNFVFSFERLGSRKLVCTSPIVNSAAISAIPPVGSIFKVPEDQATVKLQVLKTHDVRDMQSARRSFPGELGVKFSFCEVTVYDERNVDLKLKEIRSGAAGEKFVTAEITNTSDQKCRFAYFLVLHDDALFTKQDYGFFDLGPSESRDVLFSVKSTSLGRRVHVPFFAGVYLPEALRGAKEIEVMLDF